MTLEFSVKLGNSPLEQLDGTTLYLDEDGRPAFASCNGSFSALRKLARQTSIKRLRLSEFAEVTDTQFAEFAAEHPQLQQLSLAAPAITCDGACAIESLGSLELFATKLRGDSERLLKIIAGHPSILTVNLDGSREADTQAVARSLSGRKLAGLSLSAGDLDVDGIVSSANLCGLSALRVSDSNLGPHGLSRIAEWNGLQALAIGGNPIANMVSQTLRSLSSLKSLEASEIGATSKLLIGLSGLRALEQLYLSDPGIDDALVPILSSLPSLTRLCIDRCSLSRKACRALALLPQCKFVSVRGTVLKKHR